MQAKRLRRRIDPVVEQVMCGLCGLLANSDHWADAAQTQNGATQGALRQLRMRFANRVLAHYGIKLVYAANLFVLRSATGQTVLVPHLGALWPAADRIAKRPCDPLDSELVAELKRSSAGVHS
jgi:hypothetical protein